MSIPWTYNWRNVIPRHWFSTRKHISSLNVTNGQVLKTQQKAQKLFRQALPPSSDKLVSWAQFNREPLANRNFTFWQWFNGVMELTKSKHCQPHWLDKGVVGFIGKAESQVYFAVTWSNQTDCQFRKHSCRGREGHSCLGFLIRKLVA